MEVLKNYKCIEKEIIVMEKVNVMEMVKKIEKEYVDGGLNKSSMIRKLYEVGLSVGEISKVMSKYGVRYNMCYNVISNECMKKGGEVVKVDRSKGSVKDSIIKLIKEGKSNKEISVELGIIYNYVFKVRKEWELKERMINIK